MPKRFFTSDWHLGMQQMIDCCNRPFSSVNKMNSFLIKSCNARAKPEDIVIHLGDFCCYGNDRGLDGSKITPSEYLSQINATFVNIKGNHDPSNKTKSIADSIRTTLGHRFTSVSCSHYPSNNILAAGSFHEGDIHLHGHSHLGITGKKEIFFIDFKNKVLNVNLCCDLWHFQIVSEEELIAAITKFLNDTSHSKMFDK